MSTTGYNETRKNINKYVKRNMIYKRMLLSTAFIMDLLKSHYISRQLYSAHAEASDSPSRRTQEFLFTRNKLTTRLYCLSEGPSMP